MLSTSELPRLISFAHTRPHMSLPLPCADSILMDAILGGRVSEQAEFVIERHLDDCDQCRRVVEFLSVAEQSGTLTQLSVGDVEPIRPQLRAAIDQLDIDSHGRTTDNEEFILRISMPTDFAGSIGRVGEYEIMERIGGGGMGVVYRGFDARLNRSVAIKFLAAKFAGDIDFRERFVREARAAANISHPSVITVHSIAEARGVPYIVMEYVDGESLQQRLDRMGPLPLTMVARIGLQVAEGLGAAHDRHVIHRDIKPANILLCGENDNVRITDFGLAQAAGDARLTQTGQLLGTPKFMSPEQARGETLDHRSDLFSLGSLLFAMSVGTAPVNVKFRSVVVSRVANGQIDAIDDVDPTLPNWLRSTIRKLHKKDPQLRFNTAHEVATALRGRLKLPDAAEISTADMADGATLYDDDLIRAFSTQLDLQDLRTIQTQVRNKKPSTRSRVGQRQNQRRKSRTTQREWLVRVVAILVVLSCTLPFCWQFFDSNDSTPADKQAEESITANSNKSSRSATPAAPAPAPVRHPDLVAGRGRFSLVRNEHPQRRFESLREVCDAAADGDVVEIFGDTEFRLLEKLVIRKRLTIRASFDQNFNRRSLPRIVTQIESVLDDAMIEVQSNVVFEGLCFEGLSKKPFSTRLDPNTSKQAIIRCSSDSSLKLANCRLRLSPGNPEQFAILGGLADLDIVNCELIGGGVRWDCPGQQSLRLNNTLIVAASGLTLIPRPPRATDNPVVKLSNCTVIADQCFALLLPRQTVQPRALRTRLQIDADTCAFKGLSGLLQLRRLPNTERLVPDALRETSIIEHVAWRGHRNLYDMPTTYLTIADTNTVVDRASDFVDWNAIWRNMDEQAIQGRVFCDHSQGLPRKSAIVATSIYALRIDLLAADGSIPIAGTFLDRIGPGFAYDRWLMSDASIA